MYYVLKSFRWGFFHIYVFIARYCFLFPWFVCQYIVIIMKIVCVHVPICVHYTGSKHLPVLLSLFFFCSTVSGDQGDSRLHSLLSSSSSAESYLLQQQVVVNHHHSSPSSYACARCGNSYARLHSLSRHVRFECGVDPKFECPICHKKSKHKHNLLLHMKTHLKWSSDVFFSL